MHICVVSISNAVRPSATRGLRLTLLLLFYSYSAAAQEQAPAKNSSWDISVWVAGSTGEENRNSLTEAQVFSGGVFIGRIIASEIGSGRWKGNLEYGFNVIPVLVTSGAAERIYGGGFDPVVLRWSLSHRWRRVMPYIELGGGSVITSRNLPLGDTSSFNFTAKCGGGIQVLRKPQQSLDIGCRWWHISNANLGVRNPEFNGLQFSLGYHWFR